MYILVRSLSLRSGPTQHPVVSSAGTPQAKEPSEWEHDTTNKQTRCLKTSGAHNMPLDMDLPSTRSKDSSTHQWQAKDPPTRKTVQASNQASPKRTHTSEARKPKSHSLLELSPQTQVRTYPEASWSLALGWQEGNVLLRNIGHTLQFSKAQKYITLHILKNTNKSLEQNE